MGEKFKNHIRTILNDDTYQGGGLTPFATVVCGYFSWKEDTGDEVISDFMERLKLFERVRTVSASLDSLGLPRRISNEILADWSKILVKDLERCNDLIQAFVPGQPPPDYVD